MSSLSSILRRFLVREPVARGYAVMVVDADRPTDGEWWDLRSGVREQNGKRVTIRFCTSPARRAHGERRTV